jgi:nucleotide sugar dehydrogenase
MPITTRPTRSTPSLLGGSIDTPIAECRHKPARFVHPWTGAPDTVGSLALFGAGKMGLPLAAQFASHGWHVTAVDVNDDVVTAINEGRSHVAEEPGLSLMVANAHASGQLRATTDGAAATAAADVIVIIVPVTLTDQKQPDYRFMDAAVATVGHALTPGALVILETTLPVGDTRGRYGPALEAASGLRLEEELLLAFSPERLLSGHVFRDLAAYPKLVGGVGAASTERATSFYSSTLDAEVVAMSSAEAAEFAKLAETTYRDVNIALANEFANYAERAGVDILEVIAAANSQPYSHVHQPGIGVGGHCIPVYPHFLLSRAPEMTLARASRIANDGQVERGIATVEDVLGSLDGAEVLVLGMTYRDGVKELAYSRALPLMDGFRTRNATVLAFDPLLDDREIVSLGARPWKWGAVEPLVRAIVTQTADPAWDALDLAWFPNLAVLLDGRNSLHEPAVPNGAVYRGIGRAAKGEPDDATGHVPRTPRSLT